jgi:hypothetical protein
MDKWVCPRRGSSLSGDGGKPAAQTFQLPAQRVVNAVLGDVEEPTFAARCPNLSCSLGAFRCVIYQRSNVDHRNTGKLAEAHSEELVVLMFRGFLGFAPHAQEVASP